MKIAAIALATFGLAVAGSAMASDRLSDVDYLKANRCRGLAAGLGGDTASLDATLKTQGRTRSDFIVQKGEEELSRGKREAGESDLKSRLTAELNGSCMAYMTGGKETASAH